jgi:hypothetical protein
MREEAAEMTGVVATSSSPPPPPSPGASPSCCEKSTECVRCLENLQAMEGGWLAGGVSEMST